MAIGPIDSGGSKENQESDGFLLVIDDVGKIIYVSNTVQDHLGFSHNDLIGYSWFAIVHPDDQVHARSHLKDLVIRCAESFTSEYGSASKSGVRTSCTVRVLVGSHEALNNSANHPEEFAFKDIQFSGVGRALKKESNTEANSGCNVVWVAVGRPVPQPTNADRSLASSPLAAPSHFVIRHDLSGRITWLDDRFSHIIGKSSDSFLNSTIFSHVVEEDMLFLIHQYDQLADKAESIAVVYRLRSNDPNSEGTFLNCRAYLALNPATLQLDRVVTLAAKINPKEARLELKRQCDRLSAAICAPVPSIHNYRLNVNLHSSRDSHCSTGGSPENGRSSVMSNLSHQQENLDPMASGNVKSSPRRSPDSNTHPPSPRLSALKDSEVPKDRNLAAMSPDSQSSPSKHSDSESTPPQASQKPEPVPEVAVEPKEHQLGENSQPVQSPRKHDSPSKSSRNKEEKKSRKGENKRADYETFANGMRNPDGMHVLSPRSGSIPVIELHSGGNFHHQSSHLPPAQHQMRPMQSPFPVGPEGMHGPSSGLPFSDPYFAISLDLGLMNGANQMDGMEEDQWRSEVRSMFHQQLRDKHRYLERSIHNQQQQLQDLQQKLIGLATETSGGRGPPPPYLQRPLQRLTEIQNRLAFHRDQTTQQRAQVDMASERIGFSPASAPSVPASFPNNPNFTLPPRRGSAAGVMPSPVLSPRLPHVQIGSPQIRAPQTPGDQSQHHPNRVIVNEFPLNQQDRRQEGALSPPFVDMTKATQPPSPRMAAGSRPVMDMGNPLNTVGANGEQDSLMMNMSNGSRPMSLLGDMDLDQGLLELENFLNMEFSQSLNGPRDEPPAQPSGGFRREDFGMPSGMQDPWPMRAVESDMKPSMVAT